MQTEPDNLRYIELMALVGCTDEEIQKAFDYTLTPELLEHLQKVRVYGASRIPRPTPAEARKALRRERYRPRWMRFL
jgi:hypothetical protein